MILIYGGSKVNKREICCQTRL